MSAVSELDDLTTSATRAESDSAEAARAAVESLPWLTTAIDDDRAHARFGVWGRSTVIDENIGTPVISRALFDELHRRAGADGSWPHGNAGLLHCYGYLLSLAETPYGLKRERWIGTDLAHACGLASDAFVPWSGATTLLARATAAAASLLAAPATSATGIVHDRRTRVALSAQEGPAALAYEVAASPVGPPLLITLFPVTDASSVLREFEDEDAPRLRWNAA